MKHIKMKKLLVENTPKNHSGEVAKLVSDADKLLTDLINVLDSLKDKANGGVWYYSGQMANPYGIKKDKELENLFDELKEEVKGNLLYNLKREDRKYLESIKNTVKKIVAKTPSGRMKWT